MGSSTISLGLGLGGGKASTASGRPGGGGGFANQYSLSMDGTDDYLNIPHDSSLTISGDLTICGWVKRAQLANGEYFPILSKRPSSHTSTNYSFYLDALDGTGQGGMRFYDGNSVISPASPTAIAADEWTHVAITVDSGVTNGTKWYINGSAEANTSTATINKTNTDAAFVGRLGAGFSLYGEGLVDEVALFDSALSASQIASIYNSGAPGDISALSPLGWWRMGDNDEGTGTTVTDQGSGGNDGTLTNGPTFATAVPPAFSSLSADLDGSDDYLTVTQDSAINISGDVTFSAWVKQDAQSTYGAIFTKRVVGGAMNYQFLMNTGTGAIGLGHSGGSWIYDTNALATGSWWHVVATVSSGTVQFYVNGVAKTSSSGVTITGTTHDLIIGATPGFNFFNGHIDEAAIFNSALSSSQVTAIYNSGQPADLTPYSPVGWWRMGDGTGDTDSGGGAPANGDTIGTVVDQGSGGNNATGTNGPTYSSTTP